MRPDTAGARELTLPFQRARSCYAYAFQYVHLEEEFDANISYDEAAEAGSPELAVPNQMSYLYAVSTLEAETL